MVLELYMNGNHDIGWYSGYDFSCLEMFKKNNIGPKNGTKIKLKNLPISSGKNYLRFWAARKSPSGTSWESSSKAYNEHSKIEVEPGFNYFNGGMILIDKKGIATFRLILPSSYYDNSGNFESEHIHFRICSNNRMSGVFTLPLKPNINTDSSLGIITKPRYLLNKF